MEVLIPFKLKRDYYSIEGSIWTWLTVQAIAITNFHRYESLQLNQTAAAPISYREQVGEI